MEGYITLTEREMEYLFRIIDSSTSILLRHQFFLWAQGELQSLLPHGLLICMFDEGSGQPISTEKFSRTNISEVTLSELCRPEGGVVFRVISAWSTGKNRPVLLCPHNANSISYRQFANDLKRDDLERMTAHGMFDANGRTRSLFTFTQMPVALTARHAYFLELLMPHMHMALVRMLFHEWHQHGMVAGKTRKPKSHKRAVASAAMKVSRLEKDIELVNDEKTGLQTQLEEAGKRNEELSGQRKQLESDLKNITVALAKQNEQRKLCETNNGELYRIGRELVRLVFRQGGAERHSGSGAFHPNEKC